MAGTIVVGKGRSIDVRTIDFARIAEALRHRAANSGVATKLLQSVDEFGMDMICADELDPSEFKDFYRLMVDIRTEFIDAPGLVGFVDRVCRMASEDDRFTS